MKKSSYFVLILFFGLPFLAVTDFFPLHRFGMFARLPLTPTEEYKSEIQVKKGNKWQRFETGNAYVDQNYMSIWGNRSTHDLEFRKRLSAQIRKNGLAPSDSIRLLYTTEKTFQTHFLPL
ncbi:MAG TPA: hypothetical protein PKY12_02385 [Catalimonadaceae bacterium]|jgi:hypothetical protein|nr:hypothetical protein [Catalimonadaceae bacterium]